ITVTSPAHRGLLDIEADRLVFWTRGDIRQIFEGMRSPQGQEGRSLEFYLSRNVEVRTQEGKETRVLRADAVYDDVNRHLAIVLQADLEIKQPGLPEPVHCQGVEILQLNAKLFEVGRSDGNASKLPYDPGLSVGVSHATLEEKDVLKRTIFGVQF